MPIISSPMKGMFAIRPKRNIKIPTTMIIARGISGAAKKLKNFFVLNLSA